MGVRERCWKESVTPATTNEVSKDCRWRGWRDKKGKKGRSKDSIDSSRESLFNPYHPIILLRTWLANM
jgi:hypothetical protein